MNKSLKLSDFTRKMLLIIRLAFPDASGVALMGQTTLRGTAGIKTRLRGETKVAKA